MKEYRELALILISASVFFLISFFIHYPTSSPSYYSDIMTIHGRDWVAARQVPYLQANFEYPVISGLIVYFASLSATAESFYLIVSLIIYFCVIGSITIIYLLLKSHGLDTKRIFLFCIATPSFIFFSIYSFDWIGIFLSLLSIYFFFRKKFFVSAACLGLAIAARLIPAILLPIMLLNMKNWKKSLKFLLITFIVWLLPNIYFMLANFQGWLHTYQFQAGWGIEDSFLIFFFPQIGAASHYASAALMIFFIALMVKKKIYKNPTLGFLFMTLAFLISSYKVPPQYGLMLLPFLTLLPVIDLHLFHIADFANLLIILTFFSPVFSLGNALAATSPVQWISVFRQLIWLFFLIRILRLKTTKIQN